MADRLDELLSFLRPGTREDLRGAALEAVLGLTGSEDGCALLKQRIDSLSFLLDLTLDKEPAVARNAYLALVNLSAVEEFASKLVSLGVLRRLLSLLTDPSWVHADAGCTLLANLTHEPSGAEAFVKELTASGGGPSLYEVMDIFDRRGFNSHAQLHHLATVFSNITQVALARQLFLDRARCILPRLLPYVQFRDSLVRRSGVVRLLRNLCFEVDSHQWLLGDDVDLLPALLLPLAGPEQFEEEVMEKLPLDLQYLPEEKERESDPAVRKMLLEALMKLCTTKYGREHLRSHQTYVVLRELHRTEAVEEVGGACQVLIHMLIADEPGAGMENLDQVEIPEGLITRGSAESETAAQTPN